MKSLVPRNLMFTRSSDLPLSFDFFQISFAINFQVDFLESFSFFDCILYLKISFHTNLRTPLNGSLLSFFIVAGHFGLLGLV